MSRFNNPNAPQISHSVHFGEEANFVGDFLAAILYGIIVALFFRCVGALLSPTNHTRRGVRLVLVAHTVAMFLFVTVATVMGLNLQSIAYVDNRGFEDPTSSGPLGYKSHISTSARSIIPNSMFQLNQWLADGLLLYRCCVLYAMDYRVIALPCLVYLASFALGLMDFVWHIIPGDRHISFNVDLPYLSISLSLNILLTLMIIARLVLHSRQIRSAMGVTTRVGRLYKAIITALVESCALYAATFLPFLLLSIANSSGVKILWQTLNETQVIAPLLIIRRIADQDAGPTRHVVPRDIGSMQFWGQGESKGDGRTFLDTDVVGSMRRNEEAASEHDAVVEITSKSSQRDSARNLPENPPPGSPVFLAPFRNSLP